MTLGHVMLDLEGLTLTPKERELLLHPQIGGIIFFSRNFESPSQIQRLIASIRALRGNLLLAVDQEGGRVQRFKDGFTRLPAMQQFLPLYRKNSISTKAIARDCGWLMAAELLAVGIDFSFAPVLDIDDHQCSVIADRSFSSLSEEVVDLAESWIDGMQEAGMAATGKHFPGHGGVSGDSHHELPIDTRAWEDIERHDLVPFQQLAPKLHAMMPAHIVFPAIDKQYSVGFSSIWLQNILRKQLNFDGVIFSDDLSMEGAAAVGGYLARAQHALNAGCDMILVCNNPEGANTVLAGLVATEQQSNNTQIRLEKMRGSTSFENLNSLHETERWKSTSRFISIIAGT